jgi:hypothetical protein
VNERGSRIPGRQGEGNRFLFRSAFAGGMMMGSSKSKPLEMETL